MQLERDNATAATKPNKENHGQWRPATKYLDWPTELTADSESQTTKQNSIHINSSSQLEMIIPLLPRYLE